MRLTAFTDYAFRLLLRLAVAGDRPVTIEEAAKVYGISRTHLMKVANTLVRAGYLRGARGRSGGLRLARAPDEIRLGDIVRLTEPDLALVECFATGNQCVVTRACRLPPVFGEALAAFMAVLDGKTLADVMLRPQDFPVATRPPVAGGIETVAPDAANA